MWFDKPHPFPERGSPTELRTSEQRSYEGWWCRRFIEETQNTRWSLTFWLCGPLLITISWFRIQSPAPQRTGPISIPCRSKWDFWWTEWHRDRFNLRVLLFSSVSIIPPGLQNSMLFIIDTVILAVDTVGKQNVLSFVVDLSLGKFLRYVKCVIMGRGRLMSGSYLSPAIWLSMMSATFIPVSHNFNKLWEKIGGGGGGVKQIIKNT